MPPWLEQYGGQDDTSCERGQVARTLLIDRFVRQATQEFALTWTPDQDLLSYRLLYVTCPPAGWYTFPYLTTERIPDLLDTGRLIEKARRWYIEWAHSEGGEDVEAWRGEGQEHRGVLEQLEEIGWIPDWHRAVRQLPGSYASLAARLQAVKIVATRHCASVSVAGRPDWMGPCPPLAALAEQLQEERARCCCNHKCLRREAQGEVFKRCSRCKTAHYCSPACSAADWPYHKDDCRQMAAERAAEQALR